jgi:hypothetical protein
MRRRFGFLELDPVEHSSSGHSSGNGRASGGGTSYRLMQVDVEAAMKVSSALSEEINLEKLLKKIVHVILEDTGAERGFLVLEDEEHRSRVLIRNPAYPASPTDNIAPQTNEPECILVRKFSDRYSGIEIFVSRFL